MRKIQKQFVQSTLVATAALVLLATQSQAEASDFEGKIDTLRLDPGSSGARVSIEVGPHDSPCATFADWFAFENADQGVGALWASALNTALVSGRTIFIQGTGQCDSFDVEGVEFIDFHGRLQGRK